MVSDEWKKADDHKRNIARMLARAESSYVPSDPRRAADSGNQGHPDEIGQARGLHLGHQLVR